MITSTANTRIKEIRKIHDRKHRQESGGFYLEGLRIIGEALDQKAELELLIYSPDLLTSSYGQNLLQLAQERGIPILDVSPEVFKSLSIKEGPQGIAAVARQHLAELSEIKKNEFHLWVALDSVQDPGNLGTILRTADACGCKGVILLDRSTDPYDDSAVRASMGAIFSQKLIKTTFMEFKHWKEITGFPVVGTSGAALQDYQAAHYPDEMVLLMGSERQGLQEWHQSICDTMVRIPMVGRSDSLNLAVATGIVLYEIFNQRRRKEGL